MSKSIQLKNGTENYYVHPYYPVGSIYLSVTNTNPSTWFGGTWELIAQGKTLVGVDTTQTEFNTVKKTGGSKTITLTTANLPSHTHSVGAHAHGLNSHTHSVGAHAHGLNSHTHTYAKSNANTNSHTLTQDEIPKHSHMLWNSHSGGWTPDGGAKGTVSYGGDIGMPSNVLSSEVGGSGGHTHPIATTSTNTGAASGNTANSTAFNTGAASGNTANSTAFNSGATGSGTAHTNLQPYYTCYIWLRTK